MYHFYYRFHHQIVLLSFTNPAHELVVSFYINKFVQPGDWAQNHPNLPQFI